MVGKRSVKTLLREEGLEKTDNNMGLTSFPQIAMINQKNYYTEFMKRDDQILALRLQNDEARNKMTKAARDKDRALAQNPQATPADPDVDMEDADGADESAGAEAYGSKTIVIHIGSQNMRIGLATDALPKNVPMVIARKSNRPEYLDDGGEPFPKRIKVEDGELGDESTWFGEQFTNEYNAMASDFRTYRRTNKRRVLPNSRELVWNWNSRNPPEVIPKHNDPIEIDWTDVSHMPEYITGQAALRIPDDSKPAYRLHRPWQCGTLNERDYKNRNLLFTDIFTIIREAIINEVGANRPKEWSQYSCVFVVPDLYEKVVAVQTLRDMLIDLGFHRMCFIQESLAATFGAGYSSSCIVDIGAQKTSVCCVEEGMCVENSRINLKFGGEDITETFTRMMLFDKLNYSDMNLKRRYDYILAEELKQKHCTFSDEQVSVQLFDFHVRSPNKDTLKYSFKLYDEIVLAPMGLFRPNIFDHSRKLQGRRSLVKRSLDLYDGSPNDPTSPAQDKVLEYAAEKIPGAILRPAGEPRAKRQPLPPRSAGPIMSMVAPPSNNINSNSNSTPQRPTGLGNISHLIDDGEPTPSPSRNGTPAPNNGGVEEDNDEYDARGAASTQAAANREAGEAEGEEAEEEEDEDAASADELSERIVPIMPLETAIVTSVREAARGEDRKMRDFLGGIMVIGGASKTPHLLPYLEHRLRLAMADRPDLAKEVLIGQPPRELDPSVIVWKGASVFGKLKGTNDSWVGGLEYDRLGARVLNYKCMWNW